jgi:hypothetical protein
MHYTALPLIWNQQMAKKRRTRPYKRWTDAELKTLKKYSREKLPVAKVSKMLKRTEATIRMKAYSMGLSMGHRRRRA